VIRDTISMPPSSILLTRRVVRRLEDDQVDDATRPFPRPPGDPRD
jgi:hypothetical protein